MRRLLLGDIHGMKDYLEDVLEQCEFDYENDLLIQIGDIIDRGPDPFECVEILYKIKNKILIRGNHDEGFISKITTGESYIGNHPDNGQGITLEKFDELSSLEQDMIGAFFEKQVDYHITDDNILFVHGGIPLNEDIDNVDPHVLHWDREMLTEALNLLRIGNKPKFTRKYKKIYIGHTPTFYFNIITPMFIGDIINIDTGSGKGGPLTIMDIDSGQYWQSTHTLRYNTNGLDSESEETKTETGETEYGESEIQSY